MAVTYNKMTLAQLKGELTKRDLDPTGKKSELVSKLVENDAFQKEEVKRLAAEEKEKADKLAAEKKTEEEAKKKAEEEAKKAEAETIKAELHVVEADDIKKEIGDSEDKEPNENGEEDKNLETSGKEDHDGDEKKDEDEKDEEDAKEIKEEPKVELKSEDYNFIKNGYGFVVGLDNGHQIVIPLKDTLKFDMKSRRQSKTVIAYPLAIDDLKSGILQPFIEKCCHFYMNFHERNHEREKSTKGFIEFIFASDEEAEEQADIMAEIKDDLVVRKLSRKDKPVDTYQDVPQELITVATMVKRYVYIGNLPSTATEEVLEELFPDCINMAVIVNGDGLPKGYAYAEFEDDAAIEAAIKQSLKITYPGYVNKLVIMRTWARSPKGLMDSATRKDHLEKVRNMRKLRMKTTDDMVRNRLENEIALIKMKLDKDCKVRLECGLTDPPDLAIKREAEKKGYKAGTTISTIQRGMNKPGRGRGGIGRSGFGGPGRFGNNQQGVFRKPFPSPSRGGYRGGFTGSSPGYSSASGGRFGTGGFQGGPGFSGRQQGGQGGPGMNQAVEMLMQVSKMLGTNQGGSGGNNSSGSGYGNQGSSNSFGRNQQDYGNQGSSYSSSFGNKLGSGSFGNKMGSYRTQSGSQGGNYSNQGGSGQFKRSGDDDGYGGGGKRGTGFYNQNRW